MQNLVQICVDFHVTHLSVNLFWRLLYRNILTKITTSVIPIGVYCDLLLLTLALHNALVAK